MSGEPLFWYECPECGFDAADLGVLPTTVGSCRCFACLHDFDRTVLMVFRPATEAERVMLGYDEDEAETIQ